MKTSSILLSSSFSSSSSSACPPPPGPKILAIGGVNKEHTYMVSHQFFRPRPRCRINRGSSTARPQSHSPAAVFALRRRCTKFQHKQDQFHEHDECALCLHSPPPPPSIARPPLLRLGPHTRTMATLSGCLPSGLGKSSSGSSTSTDCTVRPALAAHLWPTPAAAAAAEEGTTVSHQKTSLAWSDVRSTPHGHVRLRSKACSQHSTSTNRSSSGTACALYVGQGRLARQTRGSNHFYSYVSEKQPKRRR